MLEFSLGPSLEGLGNRRLSDLTALAMYYSNRGAQALLEGSVEAAVPWLETAVRLDPDWTGGWLNLGVARRRAGKPLAAERAYRAAIDADPRNYQAFHNLAALLRLRGEGQSASEILRLLDRRENRDPFIYLSLGDDSLESGRLEEARRYYRRALWLAPEDSEPRAAMGLLALAEGHPKRARRWLDRALRDGDGTTRTLRLAERLGSSDG